MNRITKTGLIGMAVMFLLTLFLHFGAGVSLRVLVPFFMPWAVLILIGVTYRKK
jgi:hypothetical protein